MKLLSPKNDLVSGLVEERKKQYLIKWNKTERKKNKKQNKTVFFRICVPTKNRIGF